MGVGICAVWTFCQRTLIGFKLHVLAEFTAKHPIVRDEYFVLHRNVSEETRKDITWDFPGYLHATARK